MKYQRFDKYLHSRIISFPWGEQLTKEWVERRLVGKNLTPREKNIFSLKSCTSMKGSFGLGMERSKEIVSESIKPRDVHNRRSEIS